MKANRTLSRLVSRWFMFPVLMALAFLATSCCEPDCDHEVHIRAGEGAEGMVPGTVTAQRGHHICFINDDTVTHTVIFANSPAKETATGESIVLAPGKKKTIKVHSSKASGTYECHIDPPARTDGLWPPTEPQVIVE